MGRITFKAMVKADHIGGELGGLKARGLMRKPTAMFTSGS